MITPELVISIWVFIALIVYKLTDRQIRDAIKMYNKHPSIDQNVYVIMTLILAIVSPLALVIIIINAIWIIVFYLYAAIHRRLLKRKGMRILKKNKML